MVRCFYWPTGQVKSQLMSNVKSHLMTDEYIDSFSYNLSIISQLKELENHIILKIGVKEMLELTDHEVIQKCLQGNKECFAELVSRYKKLIYNAVYNLVKDRDEIDDISQEVFFKIYKSLDKYKPEYKFSTWSVTIARNLCLDLLRKKRVNAINLDEIEGVSRDNNTPESRYLKKEKALGIRRAIEKLPENYRTPVVLYYQKGKAYKEIAQLLNLPVTIVKNRLYRARLELKENVASV